jgi:hypothetical protein
MPRVGGSGLHEGVSLNPFDNLTKPAATPKPEGGSNNPFRSKAGLAGLTNRAPQAATDAPARVRRAALPRGGAASTVMDGATALAGKLGNSAFSMLGPGSKLSEAGSLLHSAASSQTQQFFNNAQSSIQQNELSSMADNSSKMTIAGAKIKMQMEFAQQVASVMIEGAKNMTAAIKGQ